MSSSTPLTRLAERLQRPFHRDGRPTRLHPASLWTEAGSTAGLALAPAWRAVRGALAALRVAGAVRGERPGLVRAGRLDPAVDRRPGLRLAGGQGGRRSPRSSCSCSPSASSWAAPPTASSWTWPGPGSRWGTAPWAASRSPTPPPGRCCPRTWNCPVGAATAVFHLPRMKPQQVHEDLFTIPTARRAVIVVGPVRSVRADPLHLLRRQVLWTEPEDLLRAPENRGAGRLGRRVHPRPRGHAHHGPVQRGRVLPRAARLRAGR